MFSAKASRSNVKIMWAAWLTREHVGAELSELSVAVMLWNHVIITTGFPCLLLQERCLQCEVAGIIDRFSSQKMSDGATLHAAGRQASYGGRLYTSTWIQENLSLASAV